jgi:hypothetical protein
MFVLSVMDTVTEVLAGKVMGNSMEVAPGTGTTCLNRVCSVPGRRAYVHAYSLFLGRILACAACRLDR